MELAARSLTHSHYTGRLADTVLDDHNNLNNTRDLRFGPEVWSALAWPQSPVAY